MTTHGHVAGSQRRTIEGLREANAGLAKQLAEARVLNEVLEKRIKGLHFANDSFGDVINRVEAVLECWAGAEEVKRLRKFGVERGAKMDAYPGPRYCKGCGCEWPCPTRRALEGEP